MAVKKFISKLGAGGMVLSAERKEILQPLIAAIKASLDSDKEAIVQFICTHNSRRSQTAEFLLDVFSREYNLNLTALSAGTESTAFNSRMVDAIQSFGFDLLEYGDDRNPLYIYKIKNDDLYYYSKRYDEELIAFDKKIVVTVCGDAEENCPLIPGTFKRLHLGYIDPKHADNTDQETEVYQNKVQEIGLEMLHIVQTLVSAS